jgi:hypothetical protein
MARARQPRKRGTAADTKSGAASAPLSLRAKLAAFFQAGRNATNPELAAMFGAPVGSIGVYRCQLKKRGLAVASPRPAKRDDRSQRLATPRTDVAGLPHDAHRLAELERVLMRNAESELGRIATRNPELAERLAHVQRTIALLLELHHYALIR